MLNYECFTVNPFQENSYLLFNAKKEACIIDPGFYELSEQRHFMDFLAKHDLKLIGCWLTHAHLDHIFGCRFIKDEFDLNPAMHLTAKVVYENAQSVAQQYGVKMDKLPDPNYQWVEKSIDVKLLGADCALSHTPGHSPGSVVFYLKDDSTVIAGDVLFQRSIGRTDLPGGDFDTLEKSIKTVMYQLPRETTVYSGHGPKTSIGFEMDNNPFVRA